MPLATDRSRSMGLPRYQVNITYRSGPASHRHLMPLRDTGASPEIPARSYTSASVSEPHSPTNAPGCGATEVAGADAAGSVEPVPEPQPARATAAAIRHVARTTGRTGSA